MLSSDYIRSLISNRINIESPVDANGEIKTLFLLFFFFLFSFIRSLSFSWIKTSSWFGLVHVVDVVVVDIYTFFLWSLLFLWHPRESTEICSCICRTPYSVMDFGLRLYRHICIAKCISSSTIFIQD